MKTFTDLNLSKQLLNALNDLGFNNPTPIQEKAFPIIMSGRDSVGIAQTGTGKTFAYLLPILRLLTYSEQRQPRVLIVVPTRELVVQVVDEIKKLTKYTSLRSGGVYGGANINTQKTMLMGGLDVLVATPGRVIDLATCNALQAKSIQKLVIDEVDEMLNLGFRSQLMQILDILPQKRQNIMFSATITEDVEELIAQNFNSPEYIEVITRGTPLEKIIQLSYDVLNYYTKVNLLKHLLAKNDDMTKVLLFVKNKKIADDLYADLEDEFQGFIGVIHSNKTQPQRFKSVEQFDDGVYRLLIATDVVARGLDLVNITHVINFDMPKEASSYIHRIGRTGRAEKHGTAISFVTAGDKEIKASIESLMNKTIDVIPMPDEVEINEELTKDEKPVTRDKNLAKMKKIVAPTGAFQEKLAKNKKVNKGGKRRQESIRRERERQRAKRKR